MYEINYSNSAVKFLKKLSKGKQKHILSVLERARIRPEAHFERLVGEKDEGEDILVRCYTTNEVKNMLNNGVQ